MTVQPRAHTRPLLERLAADGAVLCAEGYLFELERRGYLQAGAYVPEVVLDHPEVVAQLHREFVRAGSDVVEAFTYYGHREKLRLIGKEARLEALQRNALSIAKTVAAESTGEPPLVAGNISNTTIYVPGDAAVAAEARAMFDEQVAWAADARVDMVIAETFSYHGEAMLALEAIRRAGLPAVVTLAVHLDGLRDEVPLEESVRSLEQAGVDVVGLNCARGPATMLPLLRVVRNAVSCHVAGLPVPYRTTPDHATFQSLQDPACDSLPTQRPFPVALDPFTCNRYEMAAFARAAYDLGVRYIGVCCGGAPHHVRAMAEALGRSPEASRYSPDMSKHYAFGTDPRLRRHNRDYTSKL
ncbi:MAG TPA: homocysteine S-methyltransferase family protein [bacterium]|nr:homocysteine S-methyltransferase family protein [bacterium]